MSLVEFVRNNTGDLFSALMAFDGEDSSFKIGKFGNSVAIYEKSRERLIVIMKDYILEYTDFDCGHVLDTRGYRLGHDILPCDIFPVNVKSAKR